MVLNCHLCQPSASDVGASWMGRKVFPFLAWVNMRKASAEATRPLTKRAKFFMGPDCVNGFVNRKMHFVMWILGSKCEYVKRNYDILSNFKLVNRKFDCNLTQN